MLCFKHAPLFSPEFERKKKHTHTHSKDVVQNLFAYLNRKWAEEEADMMHLNWNLALLLWDCLHSDPRGGLRARGHNEFDASWEQITSDAMPALISSF